MAKTIELKRIGLFMSFAFGLAWLVSLVVYLTGGLAAGNAWALPLVAVGVMGAPALANVLARWLTSEGWRGSLLWPKLERGWPYWLAAWIGPGVLTAAGAVLYFALYPQHYDPSLKMLRDLLAQSGSPEAATDPWTVAVAQTVQAVLLAPLLNGAFTFGEEFGWRGYLQPKLMPLGGRRAVLLMGLIWGIWHAPLIAMGHNYGQGYPGAPWTGVLAMTWFTLVAGTFLGWAALRGGSVWPAVIGHGALNGIAALGALFTRGDPSSLLGPLPTGLVGGLPWVVVAVVILLWPGAFKRPVEVEPLAADAPVPPAPAAPSPVVESEEALRQRVDESRFA